MKYFVLPAVLSALLTTITTAAQAEGTYVGGTLANNHIASFCDADSNCDQDSMAGRLFAGKQFNPNVALEAGVYYAGAAKAWDTEVKTQAISADALALFPINEKLTLNLRSGLLFSQTDIDSVNPTISRQKDDVVFRYGFGLDMMLSPKLSLGLEATKNKTMFKMDYERYNFDNYLTGLTLKYRL